MTRICARTFSTSRIPNLATARREERKSTKVPPLPLTPPLKTLKGAQVQWTCTPFNALIHPHLTLSGTDTKRKNVKRDGNG